MISLKEFRKISREEQFKIVAQRGSFLCNRIEQECAIFLFAVDKLFVEVWFDNSTYYTTHCKAVNGSGKLRKYLDLITISELNPLLN